MHDDDPASQMQNAKCISSLVQFHSSLPVHSQARGRERGPMSSVSVSVSLSLWLDSICSSTRGTFRTATCFVEFLVGLKAMQNFFCSARFGFGQKSIDKLDVSSAATKKRRLTTSYVMLRCERGVMRYYGSYATLPSQRLAASVAVTYYTRHPRVCLICRRCRCRNRCPLLAVSCEEDPSGRASTSTQLAPLRLHICGYGDSFAI